MARVCGWVLLLLLLPLPAWGQRRPNTCPPPQPVPASTGEPPLAAAAPAIVPTSATHDAPPLAASGDTHDDANVIPAGAADSAPPIPVPGSGDRQAIAAAARSVPAVGRLVDPPAPQVTMHVRVPSTVAIGQEIETRVVIENPSQAAAHQVVVRMSLPANATLVKATPEPDAREPELQWKLKTLEAKGTRTLVLTFKPTGGDELRHCARVSFEHGQVAVTRIAPATLDVRQVGLARVAVGDRMPMRIEVTNNGRVDAEALVVTETLPAGLVYDDPKAEGVWQVGKLRAGQRKLIEYAVRAKAAGTHKTLVVVRGTGVQRETNWTVQVGEPKLELDHRGPATHYGNQPARYDITVKNTGTAALQNVVVTETLPPESQVARLTNGGQAFQDSVQWVIDRLEPGASRTLGVSLRVTKAGKHTLRATAAADKAVSPPAEVTTDFQLPVTLELRVTELKGMLAVGEEMPYTVTARNTGAGVATNVTLSVELPPQLKLVRSEPLGKGEGPLAFDALPTLKPGQDHTWKLLVKAVAAGDARFKADLRATELTAGAIHQEESTRVFTEEKAPPVAPPSSPPSAPLQPNTIVPPGVPVEAPRKDAPLLPATPPASAPLLK